MKNRKMEFNDFVHTLSPEQLSSSRFMPLKARLLWLEEANAFINKAIGFKKRGRYDERFRFLAGSPAYGKDVRRPDPHMADAVLSEVVRRVVEAYKPLKIYLFGSKARGDAGPDSDYDLMVIVPDDAPPERCSSRMAYERLWGTGAAADVLVWTRDAFDSRLHLKASLSATIAREGRLLYAA